MGFKRVWDSSCPRVWDSWETEGVKWVIRDLRPEDDEEAIKLLREHLCPDETLCSSNDMVNDPVSMKSATDLWRKYLGYRMSLGCYEEKDEHSRLVALNVCYVRCRGDKFNDVAEGKAWKNVNESTKTYCYDKVDPYKLLGVDKVLFAIGLVVHRDYRGLKLGYKILAAREPLALHHGIYGTSTVFSSPPAHRSAELAGFFTALTVTLKQLAEAGFDFPADEKRSLKVMMRKYDSVIKSV